MKRIPEDPAAAILEWALNPTAAPRWNFRVDGLRSLAVPSPAREAAAGGLAALARAELGLAPFSSAGPPVLTGASGIAAAIAFHDRPPLALGLLDACARPRGLDDNLIRQALVRAALAWVQDSAVADALLEAAPLAQAILGPLPHGGDAAMNVLLDLAEARGGRWAFARLLADPGPSAGLRRWRGAAIDRARLYLRDGDQLLLDIYEAAQQERGALMMNETRQAIALLRTAHQASEDDLDRALALAAWWSPLIELVAVDRAALRTRALGADFYRAGLALTQARRAEFIGLAA
ncbi:MAG: hypothetical protein K0R83_1766 [Caulobacter sp.]|jgi:hypothetical protein|nr:hypothetical protein [Caulobacter sp.]